MVRKEEVELLRKRSKAMLKHAENCLDTGDYDLACFLAEQAVQLYLKSLVLEKTGEIPRTHSIRQLLHVVREVTGRGSDIDEFVARNRGLLIALEDAYLASRYFFRSYARDEAEELVRFAKEVIRFVEGLEV